MSRIRIHELAKELELTSKDLMDKMSTMDIEFKRHASASISNKEAEKVRKSLIKDKSEAEDKVKKASETKKSHKPKNDKRKKVKEDAKKQGRKEKKRPKQETRKKTESKKKSEAADEIKIVELPELMTVQEFADIIKVPGNDVVKYFFDNGEMFTITSTLDYETAVIAAEHFGILVEEEKEVDVLQDAFGDIDEEDNTEPRPPVVVVMGHVDHGKTSLLDAIRKSKVKVTTGEAGGITQHIGAYTVDIAGKKITFLDTPGHEAFTAMRMRGARITDVAILVVAADDGVMPQTVEAINHAKAAELDIIVAINKMDKPSANPDMVKQELLEHGLVTEDWGGDTICVPVSAHEGTGLDDLLEMILLVAGMQENKANSKLPGRGAIIEASLDKGKGAVATVLVQNGTLTIGDAVVAGGAYGRVRALTDDRGNAIRQAGPSMPAEMLGLNSVPAAGDKFYVAENDRQARQLAGEIEAQDKVEIMKAMPTKVSLDDLFEQIKAGEMKDLNLIVKADVQGSVEAVRESLERLSNEEVRVRVIHGGVGAIAESDVMLASASNAIIIGFNVRPEVSAKTVAETEQVDIRLYRVIYNAIEDIEMAMKGLLDPIYEEQVIGHAEVRQLFKASGVTIAGSYVTDGMIGRNSDIRLTRDNVVIFEGKIDSLKRFQDDVREVKSGYECGISLERFNDIKVGDIFEAFEMVEIER